MKELFEKYTSDSGDKSANIYRKGSNYEISFHKDGFEIGRINYKEHDISFVRDAAFNYSIGVFKEDDVKSYNNVDNPENTAISRILSRVEDYFGVDPHNITRPADILADIIHYCSENNIDYDNELNSANLYYEEELLENNHNKTP